MRNVHNFGSTSREIKFRKLFCFLKQSSKMIVYKYLFYYCVLWIASVSSSNWTNSWILLECNIGLTSRQEHTSRRYPVFTNTSPPSDTIMPAKYVKVCLSRTCLLSRTLIIRIQSFSGCIVHLLKAANNQSIIHLRKAHMRNKQQTTLLRLIFKPTEQPLWLRR